LMIGLVARRMCWQAHGAQPELAQVADDQLECRQLNGFREIGIGLEVVAPLDV